MGQFFEWVLEHWAFSAFVIGMIFEIPSLKLKPFSRLIGLIGRILNKDLITRIDKLSQDVDNIKDEIDLVKKENEKQIEMIDMTDVNFIRSTILDFANSIRQGTGHTQEEYDHIIELNDRYEGYIEKYDIKNGRFTHAYRYILTSYSDCLENNSFLA